MRLIKNNQTLLSVSNTKFLIFIILFLILFFTVSYTAAEEKNNPHIICEDQSKENITNNRTFYCNNEYYLVNNRLIKNQHYNFTFD